MNPLKADLIPVAYDCVLRRPGCVLVAATMGGNTQAAQEFPVESWLLVPTPDMKVYQTTPDQLRQLVLGATKAMRERSK